MHQFLIQSAQPCKWAITRSSHLTRRVKVWPWKQRFVRLDTQPICNRLSQIDVTSSIQYCRILRLLHYQKFVVINCPTDSSICSFLHCSKAKLWISPHESIRRPKLMDCFKLLLKTSSLIVSISITHSLLIKYIIIIVINIFYYTTASICFCLWLFIMYVVCVSFMYISYFIVPSLIYSL